MNLVEQIAEFWNYPEVFARSTSSYDGMSWLERFDLRCDEFYEDTHQIHPKRIELQIQAIKNTISLIFDSRSELEKYKDIRYIQSYSQLISKVRKEGPAWSLIDSSAQVRLCTEILIEKGVI